MNIRMLGNYFKISRRHLLKNKVFTIVTIMGLATGIAGGLLIYQYTSFERSFDRFHANYKNIYRVTTTWNPVTIPNDDRATTVPWTGPGVKEAFPEVLEYTRLAPVTVFTGDTWVRYNQHKAAVENIYYADPGFFKIFSFPLLKGNPAQALKDPFSVVITETMARTYFGDEDPIGKIITIESKQSLMYTNWGASNDFKVTGVLADTPANSHITIDMLLSYASIWPSLADGSTYWQWDFTYCYYLLHPMADAKELGKKMTDLRTSTYKKEMTAPYYDDVLDFRLQPLEDIHLYSSLKGEAQLNGDGRSIQLLFCVGVCILLSAYINFVNLSTVKAVERKVEIGVRKIVGSSKLQLVSQLLVESLVLNIAALALAFVIGKFSIPLFEKLFNITWPEADGLFTPKVLLTVIAVVFVGILLSAIYPAFVLTAFNPAEVLKGSGPLVGNTGRWTFRKSLIVMQFVFCTVFTIATFALYKQLRYMKQRDLGVDMNQVMVVRGYGFEPYKSFENFKMALGTLSMVQSVGGASAAPGDEINLMGLGHMVMDSTGTDVGEIKMISADEDFFKTLGVKVIAGRVFSRHSKADEKAVLINEATARLLGYDKPEDAINQTIEKFHDDIDLQIVGVVKDYNQLSLRHDYEPLVFTPHWFFDEYLSWNKRYTFIRLQLAPGNGLPQAIAQVEKAWKRVSPDQPFQYFFLDHYFEAQYKADTALGALFLFFSGFSIFITCLGLFGLVAYMTLQRTKEIGVRKVLGASIASILMLLSKDFMKLVLVACVIAVPLTWWGLHQWLSRYVFRIEIDVWLFFVPLILIFAVAILTIVLKSMRVAASNPVDSLRHD